MGDGIIGCRDSVSLMPYHPSPYSHRALRPAGCSIREWRVVFLRSDVTVTIGCPHQDVGGRPGSLEREDPSHPGEIGVDRWLQGSVGPGLPLIEADLHPVD